MSAFGVHVTQGQRQGFGAALQQCAAAGSPVPLLYALDQNLWSDVSQLTPSTVLIFRTQPRINNEGWDNPPGMYSADPIGTADFWYALCKPTWLLNRAHYYAPSNERNPLPVQDAWIDAFDLRLMQLADADGLKLALHGDSMGTPGMAQWQNYRTSLQYAAQHGHIITLHEPITGASLALRYRDVHTIVEQFAPGLKIAISECYGDLTGDPIHYVNSFAAYDAEAMKDKYLIGFAAYQIGGDESFAAALPQWADYVSAHPTPEVEPVAIIPLCGLHSPASAGDISAVELSAIDRAARFASYKFQTGDTPAHYAAIAAHGIPLASCFTRLSMDMRNRPKPTPQEFVNDMSTAITEARNVGIRFFEIHNEPNIQAVEWPWSSDPHDFITWLLGVPESPGVIPLLRATFPGIGLISPGLAPAANTDLWWQEFAEHGVFNNVEGIGAHVYWPNRATMLTQAQGLHFIPLVQYSSATKSIIITELSNNINGDTDYDKGLQYIDWCSYVAAHYPTVTRSYWYALSSTTQSDNDSRQTLVRNGAITPIADGIRDGVFNPAPAPQYVYQHSHLDGGLANTSKTITITMNQAHNLVGDYAEVAPVVKQFPLTITTTPPGAGSYTVTPPLPANGLYNEGTIVTVVFA